MLSRANSIMALLAIIIAPACSFLLPPDITNKLVTSHVVLKDAVLLSSIAILACLVYSAEALRVAMRWLARKPFYRKIDFNYIYLSDGTVITRTSYDYINGWHPSSELPREDLIWHKRITKNDLLYRFYERGKLRDRNISSGAETTIEAIPRERENSGADHRYSWTPAVRPPLGIKENISFVVEIMSPKTETAAFQAGTKLGFGVNVPTIKACLEAHAPFGYRFVLLDPSLTIRNTENLNEIAANQSRLAKPAVSADGSRMTLEVKRPMLGRRYWVHYRFEKVQRVS